MASPRSANLSTEQMSDSTVLDAALLLPFDAPHRMSPCKQGLHNTCTVER
jgi:hypothetical protein